MLIQSFEDETLERTLSIFVDDIRAILNRKLRSIYLYGSATHNDLSPGYGDLDFLVVIGEDLSQNEIELLNKQRSIYRSSLLRRSVDRQIPNLYTDMLEGAFLTISMLSGEKGSGLWWGTKRESVWTENQLDLFTLYTIKEQSILLYGKSHLDNVPSYSREEFISFFKEYAKSMRMFGKGNSLHSVDWLLLASKFIAWWQEGVILSKSQAADWGLLHLSGGWKENLKRCKKLRKDPSMVTCLEYSEWLSNLEPAIIEASHDLDRALETTKGGLSE
ncbi:MULTISPECIES: nucleotidyltransferase domain-containing protein [Paenibacillus]|uniref:Adenylyltransferase AadA C-terminal domain-containing protein n=1 Tax=Paenibacillus borealis TaxID=160799 RepID=A0ABX3HR04_PAEBO|nr:nucleotidyltransferase domain-containing protein [Paenibacillus borealis]OMD52416.1 hypothetical protein BSK56_03115 [Paenibacillus borealis]